MSDSPFDGLPGATAEPGNRKSGPGALAAMWTAILRFLSAITLGLAISTAIYILALHLVRFTTGYRPAWPPLNVKSAIPLILIGISYSCLLFTLPRSRMHRFLGLLAGLAFVLWGTEQFLTDRAVISLIDDGVVFLFVLDLSAVIYGHLKTKSNR